MTEPSVVSPIVRLKPQLEAIALAVAGLPLEDELTALVLAYTLGGRQAGVPLKVLLDNVRAVFDAAAV